MNYLTEVINLGVLSTTVTTPSQREFIFDFDFDGQNFMRMDIMAPGWVTFGTSTAVFRNGLVTNGVDLNLNNTNNTSASITINTSASGSTYLENLIGFSVTYDNVNNKIILRLIIGATPNIPTWACLNFRAWTVI
ncbi:MAG: hypothetical protein ACRC0Y_11140 [Fusobacteriaceae bacterium]